MTLCGYVPRGRFGYWEKRFASRPRKLDAFAPVHYLNCPDLGPIGGFVRQIIYTILLDLSRSEEDLLHGCKANTRNEIARAGREGAKMRLTQDPQNFLELYAAASQYKRLPATDTVFIKSYGKNLQITEVWQDQDALAAHIYITDPGLGRVRLIRSASLFRSLEKTLQQRVGRANRFLHFQDVMHFKRLGFHWYDLGGYDPPGTELNEELRRVSDFKASFGGQVIQEANYLSWALHLYRRRSCIIGRTSGPE